MKMQRNDGMNYMTLWLLLESSTFCFDLMQVTYCYQVSEFTGLLTGISI
jgi:hypothetical protein